MDHADRQQDNDLASLTGDYLARLEVEGSSALDELEAKHPDDAQAIRTKIERAIELGLVPAPSPLGRFGPFILHATIGTGGSGSVYRATDSRTGHAVALKTLNGVVGGSPERLARFQREAEITKALDHEHVVRVRDTGIIDGIPYIAMELVHGQTLQQFAERLRQDNRGATTTATLLRVIEKVARATDAIHRAGIVHRDIKPQNILINDAGEPVLVDFGMAHGDDYDTLTRTGDNCGTPAYMSPEQIAGNARDVDARSDIWSLGVTAYECLAGTRPFDGPTSQAVYRNVLEAEPPSIRTDDTITDRNLNTVLATALAKAPEHRYLSAGGLADDLAALAQQRPVSVREPAWPIRATRWANKHRVAVAMLVLLTGLAAVLGFVSASWDEIARGTKELRRDETEMHLAAGYLHLTQKQDALAHAAFTAAGNLPAAVLGHILVDLRTNDLPTARKRLEAARTSWQGDALDLALIDRLVATDTRAPQPTDEGEATTATSLFIRGLLLRHQARTQHDGQERHGLLQLATEQLIQATMLSSRPRPYFRTTLVDVAATAGHPSSRSFAETALDLWPHSTHIKVAVASAIRRIDREWSHQLLAEAARVPEGSFVANLALGASLIEIGNLEAALAPAKAALAADPEQPTAMHNLAMVHAGLGHVDETRVLYQKLMSVQPGDRQYPIRLASLEGRNGNHEAAEKILIELLTQHPTFANAHYMLGATYEYLGRPEEAVAPMREALRLDPKRGSTAVHLARILLRTEGHVAAEQLLRAQGPEVSSAGEIAYLLATIYQRTGRPDEQLQQLRIAAKAEPTADRFAYLADALTSRGRYSEAYEAATRAVAADDGCAHAHSALGQLLNTAHRFDEAIEHYRKAAELAPTRIEPPIFLANAFVYAGRYDEAITVLDKCLARPQLRPEAKQVATGVRQLCIANKQHAGNLGTQLSSDSTIDRLALARVACATGQSAEALALYRSVKTKLSPKDQLRLVFAALRVARAPSTPVDTRKTERRHALDVAEQLCESLTVVAKEPSTRVVHAEVIWALLHNPVTAGVLRGQDEAAMEANRHAWATVHSKLCELAQRTRDR